MIRSMIPFENTGEVKTSRWWVVFVKYKITMREACRAMRYTVQPLAPFSSCCLMTVFTSTDRDDWLATKITVAKET